MEKKSFLMYHSYLNSLKRLTDEQFGRLTRTLLRYSIDGTEDVDDDIAIAFDLVKEQIDRDKEKYENIVQRNKENGKKGGRPSKKSVLEETQKTQWVSSEPKKAEEEEEEEKEEDKDKDKDFIKESSSEIKISPTPEVEPLAPAIIQESDCVAKRKEKSCAKKEKKVSDAQQFREALLSINIEEYLVDDYIKLRRAKRGTFTRTVLEALNRESIAANISIADAIRVCVEQNWQGFRAEWYFNLKQKSNAAKGDIHQQQRELAGRVAANCEAAMRAEENGTYIPVFSGSVKDLPF